MTLTEEKSQSVGILMYSRNEFYRLLHTVIKKPLSSPFLESVKLGYCRFVYFL